MTYNEHKRLVQHLTWRLRFGLRGLLVVVTVVGIAFGLARWWRLARPDLVVISVEIQPATPQVGEPISAKVTYANIGRRPARNVGVVIDKSSGNMIDGDGWGHAAPLLEPGEQRTYTWDGFRFTEPGTHEIDWLVEIAPDEFLFESNDSNNSYRQTVTIVE